MLIISDFQHRLTFQLYTEELHQWTTLTGFAIYNRPLTISFHRLFQSDQRITSADINF
jgi:hypothetical protein